jgi:hypothetical protein
MRTYKGRDTGKQETGNPVHSVGIIRLARHLALQPGSPSAMRMTSASICIALFMAYSITRHRSDWGAQYEHNLNDRTYCARITAS